MARFRSLKKYVEGRAGQGAFRARWAPRVRVEDRSGEGAAQLEREVARVHADYVRIRDRYGALLVEHRALRATLSASQVALGAEIQTARHAVLSLKEQLRQCQERQERTPGFHVRHQPPPPVSAPRPERPSHRAMAEQLDQMKAERDEARAALHDARRDGLITQAEVSAMRRSDRCAWETQAAATAQAYEREIRRLGKRLARITGQAVTHHVPLQHSPPVTYPPAGEGRAAPGDGQRA